MYAERRFELRITCGFCGHINQMTIATVSLPECNLVNCSVCGGAIGTLDASRTPPELETSEPRLAS